MAEKYSKGMKTGEWKSWYRNGQMKTDFFYKENKLEGKCTTWYESGQKEIDAQAHNDEYIGHYVCLCE